MTDMRRLLIVLVLVLAACGPRPHGNEAKVVPSLSPTATAQPTATPVDAAFPEKPNVGYLKMTGAVGWSYAWGRNGAARAYRTANAGIDWVPLSLPDSVVGMFALDADHAWVVLGGARGAMVEATSDSGRSWLAASPLGIPAVVADTTFTDPLVGSLSVVGADGASASYVTGDGGRTWAALALPAAPGCPGRFLTTFSDRLHGLLVPEACAAPAGLWRTDDGGSSWVSVVLPPAPWTGPGATLFSLQVPVLHGQDGWMVGAGGVTTGANALQHAWLYRTHDGGRTWTEAGLPATPGPNRDFSRAPSLWFAGYVNGDNERAFLYHSADAGSNWNRVRELPFNPRGLQFNDDLHGYAAGFDAIWVTADGGRTWGNSNSRA